MGDSCDLFVLHKQYPSGGKIWLMLGLDTAGSDYKDILAIYVRLLYNTEG